jgi:hypothetical protein
MRWPRWQLTIVHFMLPGRCSLQKDIPSASHFYLGVALRGFYRGKIIDLLKTFDKIRLSRHNVQYGGALVSEDEAPFVIDFARDFLVAAKAKLLAPK